MGAKVSICIPAYMQVEFLRKTLHAIGEQSFTDYELIISDDSIDNSVQNLLSEFDFGEKFLYFQNIPSLGTPANWNYVQSKASGKYIKLVHHDDFFTSTESLGKFVKLLDDNPGADLGFSATEVWSLASDAKRKHECTLEQFEKIRNHPSSLFLGNRIGSPSATIYKNDSLIAYDETMKWLVDIDYYIQRIKANPQIVFTSEALICTVDGAKGQVTQGLITDGEIQIREHLYLFSKIISDVKNTDEYVLYFQSLFDRFNIFKASDLESIYKVPQNLKIFLDRIFKIQETKTRWKITGKNFIKNKLKKIIPRKRK
jgi:glycosyltransferase involved in cell wall biosynthesis